MKSQLRKVSTEGRIGIPAELRKKLALKSGMQIDWKADDGRLILTPVRGDFRRRRQKG
ncbi:MAG: AbrB/MazE/SpoVT family DNA-binding domain-containing protein [Candidatus Sulfotelmatobacter sp.]